jgi:hypothetical protein
MVVDKTDGNILTVDKINFVSESNILCEECDNNLLSCYIKGCDNDFFEKCSDCISEHCYCKTHLDHFKYLKLHENHAQHINCNISLSHDNCLRDDIGDEKSNILDEYKNQKNVVIDEKVYDEESNLLDNVLIKCFQDKNINISDENHNDANKNNNIVNPISDSYNKDIVWGPSDSEFATSALF